MSFWGALALLMGLGMRYPLQMLPLLLPQLPYKIVWLAGVAFPLWSGGRWTAASSRFAMNFILPIVVDALIIPWPYVLARYIRAPAERTSTPAAPASSSAPSS